MVAGLFGREVHLEAAVADGLYLVWYVVAVAADADLEAAFAGLASVDCKLALLVDDAVGYVQHLDSLRVVGFYFEGCSLLSLGGKRNYYVFAYEKSTNIYNISRLKKW